MQPLVNHPAAFSHSLRLLLSYLELNTPPRSPGFSFITASPEWILVTPQQCASINSLLLVSWLHHIAAHFMPKFPEGLSGWLEHCCCVRCFYDPRDIIMFAERSAVAYLSTLSCSSPKKSSTVWVEWIQGMYFPVSLTGGQKRVWAGGVNYLKGDTYMFFSPLH